MMLGNATSDGPESVGGKQRGDRPDENAGLEAVAGGWDGFGPDRVRIGVRCGGGHSWGRSWLLGAGFIYNQALSIDSTSSDVGEVLHLVQTQSAVSGNRSG